MVSKTRLLTFSSKY